MGSNLYASNVSSTIVVYPYGASDEVEEKLEEESVFILNGMTSNIQAEEGNYILNQSVAYIMSIIQESDLQFSLLTQNR